MREAENGMLNISHISGIIIRGERRENKMAVYGKFEVIATGKNEFYGHKDEKVLMGNQHMFIAVKEGWIYPSPIEYIKGSSDAREINVPVEVKPIIKRIEITRELKLQTNILKRFEKELEKLKNRDEKILKLLENEKA